MTVSTTTNRVGYTGDGVSTVFSFPYKFIAAADLVVYVAGVLLLTGYTVGTPTDSGANVTFTTAPANGASIIILANPAQLQSTSLPSTGPFPAKAVETALDKLTLLIQRVSELATRSFRLSDSDTSGASTILPSPSSNALIGWDSTASALQNVNPTTLATIVAFGTANADVFTGTGAQTVFTLSANPGAQANLDVAVGGVTQLPGVDYVWSGGTTVTFTTAPPNGVKVLLRYMQALPQGATDSASSTYLVAGSGAVSRTVQERLRDVVSAFDFFSVSEISDVKAGTLTIDVGSKLQTAINNLAARSSKGMLYLPAGRYRISAALQIPYGVSIKGEGATASDLVCYSCNGLNFTTYGYEIGSMFYEDFGLTSGSGANFTAIVTAANASTMDGLYFNRLRFYGFNECFNFAANWNCTVSNCVGQNINVGVAVSGVLVGLRIVNNRFTYGSGGNGAASRIAIDVRGGTIQESIHILQNQIYGFNVAISAPTVSVFVNILDNDISALVTAITYTTVNGVLNIEHNYIETFGIGITGAAQGAPTPTTQTNIKDNCFIGQGGTATVGLQLNGVVNTYQFNTSIEDNNFNGFLTHDIRLYSPGKTRVENNRCMSSVTTYSIWIGQVIAGPVKVATNWFNKAVYIDIPSDVTNGLLLLDHNTEANTFQTYRGTFAPVYASQAGAFGAITYSYANGSYERIGNLCFFNLTIVASALAVGTASTGAYISLGNLPFTAAATVQATSVAVGDATGWGANTPSGAFLLSGTKNIALVHRATSNGATAATQVSDMTAGAGNRITLSGVFLCA